MKLSEKLERTMVAVGPQDQRWPSWALEAQALEERAEAAEERVAELKAGYEIRLTQAVEADNECHALRTKLDAVRAVSQKEIDFCDEHGGHPSTVATDILAILDKLTPEGDAPA